MRITHICYLLYFAMFTNKPLKGFYWIATFYIKFHVTFCVKHLCLSLPKWGVKLWVIEEGIVMR